MTYSTLARVIWSNKVNDLLSCEFAMKDLKDVEYCLGIEIKMVV
jgi:hypothetical protein